MNRRNALVLTGLWGLSALGTGAFGKATDGTLPARARQGGVLMIRHTRTEAGLGDPPEFALGACSTQRNLSAEGRREAQAIGIWFRQHHIRVHGVRSSQWCRCQDTARLAFGRYEDWPALNSTFGGQGQHEQQLQKLRERLQQLPADALEVWVTHQVIMTGLTGAFPAMGEGFLVDAGGAILSRGMMTPTPEPAA